MTSLELMKFIQEEIKPLWPEWTLTDVEMDAWVYNLRQYSKEILTATVKEFYAGKHGQFKYPKMFPFIQLARMKHFESLPKRKASDEEMVCHYKLKCIKHDFEPNKVNQVMTFWGKRKEIRDDNTMLDAATAKCDNVSQLYGGDWVIEQTWQEYKEEAPPSTRSRVFGKAAQEKASQEILAGPDCPAKAFLLRRQKPKSPVVNKPSSDPEKIGDILTDEIPF